MSSLLFDFQIFRIFCQHFKYFPTFLSIFVIFHYFCHMFRYLFVIFALFFVIFRYSFVIVCIRRYFFVILFVILYVFVYLLIDFLYKSDCKGNTLYIRTAIRTAIRTSLPCCQLWAHRIDMQSGNLFVFVSTCMSKWCLNERNEWDRSSQTSRYGTCNC